MLSRQQNSLCQVWETRGAGHPGWASNSIQPERRGRRGGRAGDWEVRGKVWPCGHREECFGETEA